MKNRLIFSLCFVSFLLLLSVLSCHKQQTPTDMTPLAEDTPTPELAEAALANGSDIADLLNNPPVPNESIEIDAYFSGANPFIMIGDLRTYYEDRVNCPDYLNNLLTDEPFLAGLSVLHRGMSNLPTAESAWFLAATSETAQPGAYPQADLPYHARLRGHFGDAAFADCENHDRIFLVEGIVTVYAQDVPNPPPQVWEVPADYVVGWPRYKDESLGYSFLYPPNWQIEPADARELAGSLLVRYPDRPDYPVLIRVHLGEAQLDRYGKVLEPPTLVGRSMQPFVQGDGAGMNMPHNQHLSGFYGEPMPQDERRTIAVYFLGDGRTYEIALAYPMGFAASQTLLTDYSIIVESFRLDFLPDPTPTALLLW
jgi:hypothetical protein